MPDVVGQSISKYLEQYLNGEITYKDVYHELHGLIKFCSEKDADREKILDIIDQFKFEDITLYEAVKEIKGMME
jgi:acyl-CoA-binding protein